MFQPSHENLTLQQKASPSNMALKTFCLYGMERECWAVFLVCLLVDQFGTD